MKFYGFLSSKLPKQLFILSSKFSKMTNKPILKTIKVDNNAFHSVLTPELNILADLFNKNKYEIRIAGGAVRDILMEIPPADVDFATTATPTEMKQMFEAEGIRMLHKKGEEHGTITCRINDAENFEVTTLRIDEVCDGRRAAVKYTTDWELDAFRRDLTVNSLFLGLDGTIYDYTGGIDDIKERKIRFVGNAVDRIQEDYLRILRYFRFYGRIAKEPNSHDAETLKAIIDNKNGMANLSGERIWTELKRIVVGRYAGAVMRTMLDDCGLYEYIGLNSKSANIDEFCRVFDGCTDEKTGKGNLEPCTVLSTMFKNEDDVMDFHKKCKISNHEKSLSLFIVKHLDNAYKNKGNLKFFQILMLDEQYVNRFNDEDVTRLRVVELLKYVGEYDLVKQMKEWSAPKLPVNGIHLKKAGAPGGQHVKYLLLHLYDLWKNSNFEMTLEDLLKHKDDKIDIPESGPKAKKQKIK